MGRKMPQDAAELAAYELQRAEDRASMRRGKPIPEDAKLTTLVGNLTQREYPTEEEIYERSRAFFHGKQAARFEHDRGVVEKHHADLIESYIQYAPEEWQDDLRERFYSEAEGLRFGRFQFKLDAFAKHIAELRSAAIQQGNPVPNWRTMRHPKSGKKMTAPPHILCKEDTAGAKNQSEEYRAARRLAGS